MGLTRLFRPRTALCIPRPGGAFLADLTETGPAPGMVLSVPENTDPAALLRLAAQRGLIGRRLVLAALFPTLRVETLRCPDMTAADLAETMHWERDRLFRTDQPLAFAWTVLSHGPEGWDTAAAACPEASLRPWTEGARRAGFRVAEAAVPLPQAGECLLLAGRTGTLALTAAPRGLIKRRLTADDASPFLADLADRGLSLFPIPLSDCTEADWERRAMPFLPAPTPLPAALAALAQRLARPAPLNLAFPEDRDQPFLRGPDRWRRMAQGACLLAGLACLWAGGAYLAARSDLAAEEARFAALTASRRAMVEAAAARRSAETRAQEARDFAASDPQWMTRLLTLSDAIPAGIVVTDITAAGGTVRLSGTAAGSASVPLLQQRLAAAWNLPCRIDSLRREERLPLVRFTLLLGEGGAP